MSQENVEIVRRGVEAGNRRDVEAMIEVLDPEIEWHSALLMSLEGEAALYRGHEGIRTFFGDLNELFDRVHAEYPEIRDLGDRVVGIGRIRVRGRGSGAETESPIATLVDLKNGKGIRIRTYLDPQRGPRSRRAVGVGAVCLFGERPSDELRRRGIVAGLVHVPPPHPRFLARY
jgi:ketosteroid isomerase-like protein